MSLEEQTKIELIGGQCFVVLRAIGVSRAVHSAAVVFDNDEVLALSDVFRALKHHEN